MRATSGNPCDAANSRSFIYDLVGGALKRERNGQAEHLGGLEVDDELKSGWLDHREIGRLLAFENAGRANADLVINFVEVGAVKSEEVSSVSRSLPAVTTWVACPMLRAVASISIGGYPRSMHYDGE